MRLGFIGGGVICQLAHISAYQEISDCELTALADDRVRSAQVIARRYGVKRIYGDFREMLDREELDGVVISTGYALHHALVPEVIERGIPLITDVPIAASAETAGRLVEMADERGIPYHLGYIRRFDPAVRMARETVKRWRETGECGRITFVRITMPFRRWPYGMIDMKDEMEGGDFGLAPEPLPEYVPDSLKGTYLRFIGFYINQINLLRYLMDEEFEIKYVDPQNTLIVMASRGGITCSLEMAQYGLRNRWEEFYKICFDDGKIDLKLAAPLSRDVSDVMIYRGRSGELIRPDLPGEWSAKVMAEHFVNSVPCGDHPISPASEGVKDLNVAKQYIRRLNLDMGH